MALVSKTKSCIVPLDSVLLVPQISRRLRLILCVATRNLHIINSFLVYTKPVNINLRALWSAISGYPALSTGLQKKMDARASDQF